MVSEQRNPSISASAWHRLRGALAGWRRRLGGVALSLQPLDQLEPVPGQPGWWQATGNDPKFACLAGDLPLRAGWYRLAIELEDGGSGRLEPTLYMDYGYGMHETQSLYLGFVRRGARRHVGVVLFPTDVRQMRFDPSSAPCRFHVGGVRLVRIGRIGAAWRMLCAVARQRAKSGSGYRELIPAAWRKLRGYGGRHAFASWLLRQYAAQGDAKVPTYERWLALYDQPGRPVAASADMLISVLLPTYNTPEEWLRRCLDSVLAQTWPHWELCVCDDASTLPRVSEVLKHYAARDQRIRITWRESNGHISAASNDALAMARGDWVALLDHDDELHPAALAEVVAALHRHPRWQLLYTDEDKIDSDGRRHDPYFKPDWNPDLLRGQNCVSHLGVYSRALVNGVGGFRGGLEGSQDWDLVLRCSERLAADQIGHVPMVLYHWRAIEGSTAQGVGEKSYAHEAGRRALREHLERTGVAGDVLEIDGMLGAFRVRYPLSEPLPFVSIIVPTRDRLDLLRRCVESILERTTYPHYEILIVDNQSAEPESLAYLAGFRGHSKVRVRRHDHPFNYSSINNGAVEDCRGELVCLLNNDIEVITPGWLEELASHALRPQVGAVGAMLYYPDDTIQHAGVVIGVHGVAAHPYCGMPRGFPGQMGRARLVQGMSAVTAACLMVRREVYLEAGGLDTGLRVAFNDIDFCLRLRQLGYINIWTPFAELYHHESASRGQEDTAEKRARFMGEVEFMKHRWGGQLEWDPAYNPNLTLSGEPFTLAFPPREWSFSSSAAAVAGAVDDPQQVRRSRASVA
ncbi:glycosyltransferase family 2 protein [Rhodanobacter lindaniclasticus]